MRFSIFGYPTILAVNNGTTVGRFAGEYTLPNLMVFVHQVSKQPPAPLTVKQSQILKDQTNPQETVSGFQVRSFPLCNLYLPDSLPNLFFLTLFNIFHYFQEQTDGYIITFYLLSIVPQRNPLLVLGALLCTSPQPYNSK